MMRIQNPDDNRFIYRLQIKFMKCEAANCTGGNWAGRPSEKVYATQKWSKVMPDGARLDLKQGRGQDSDLAADLLKTLGRSHSPHFVSTTSLAR